MNGKAVPRTDQRDSPFSGESRRGVTRNLSGGCPPPRRNPMKLLSLLFMSCLLVSGTGFAASVHAGEQASRGQTVIPAGSRPSSFASGEHFTGKVRVDPAFRMQSPARAYGAYVTFKPGARTDWHTHPLGQTLIVTFGTGLTQEWGGPVKVIRQGDVVMCPPGVRHWHGAAPDAAMTHLAIGEHLDGKSVEWMEKVSEEQYRSR